MSTNVILTGQSIQTVDRDTKLQNEHDQFLKDQYTHVDLPFTPTPAELPKKSPLKTKFELKRELDELFDNFKIVLLGKDVDIPHKQRVIGTLLDNYKQGSADVSNRSRALLLDLYSELLGGL